MGRAVDEPFFLAKALKWYKRQEVQRAIQESCADREVAPRFGDGFGKRPDEILYPGDVLALATRKATSFHCSEERWRQVSQIRTGASRKEMDALRSGWDLVLDIDCPYWFFAKLTAHLFVKALRAHGVESISAKFSGGKGFHIGVPFEAFPERIGDEEVRTLFPEAPRAIAAHLLEYIADPANGLVDVRNNRLIFDRWTISFEKLAAVTGRASEEFLVDRCRGCGAAREEESARLLYLCTSCGAVAHDEERDYRQCEQCGGIMELQARGSGCTRCGGEEFERRFNVGALIEVDTVLIASRHLFRTPYSLHEKSGLASIVLPCERIMEFEKEGAKPEAISDFPPFLARDARPGEAARLLQEALERSRKAKPVEKSFAVPEEAIPEEYFPPCMQLILQGLEDGKKRAMFALTNFLRTSGWGFDQIEARIWEWNKQNPEPLREVVVKSHLRQVRMKQEAFPPPNCKRFYQDIGVCKPDNFCARIKNPAQYARLRVERAPRRKLTEKQKEARRAYRARQREERTPGAADKGAADDSAADKEGGT